MLSRIRIRQRPSYIRHFEYSHPVSVNSIRARYTIKVPIAPFSRKKRRAQKKDLCSEHTLFYTAHGAGVPLRYRVTARLTSLYRCRIIIKGTGTGENVEWDARQGAETRFQSATRGRRSDRISILYYTTWGLSIVFFFFSFFFFLPTRKFEKYISERLRKKYMLMSEIE